MAHTQQTLPRLLLQLRHLGAIGPQTLWPQQVAALTTQAQVRTDH